MPTNSGMVINPTTADELQQNFNIAESILHNINEKLVALQEPSIYLYRVPELNKANNIFAVNSHYYFINFYCIK